MERVRVGDGQKPGAGRSVRSDQAPRVWRVSDRLDEADLRSLGSGYSAGTTARELVEQFHISKSSVKRLLRERGIRRAPDRARHAVTDHDAPSHHDQLSVTAQLNGTREWTPRRVCP